MPGRPSFFTFKQAESLRRTNRLEDVAVVNSAANRIGEKGQIAQPNLLSSINQARFHPVRN